MIQDNGIQEEETNRGLRSSFMFFRAIELGMVKMVKMVPRRPTALRSLVLVVLLALEAAGLSVDETFDPNSGEVYLQRKYVVGVPPKGEECYFIDGVLQGQKLNFHYVVSPGLSLLRPLPNSKWRKYTC